MNDFEFFSRAIRGGDLDDDVISYLDKLDSIYSDAQKWHDICKLAGYAPEQCAELTPGIVAQALKTHGFKLPKQYENVIMPACDGNGGGWCNCPECED